MFIGKPFYSALFGVLAFISCSAWAENTPESYPVDKASGLIMAPGWELVKGQCNACHTSLIIAQNSGSKEAWQETLQWMIDTQGLWDLSDTWEPVLSYLSTWYGEAEIDMETFRRKPLDTEYLPPMPSLSKEGVEYE